MMETTPTPRAIGWGWEADDRSLLSLSIRWMCRPGWAPKPIARWSHMFMVFAFDELDLNCVHQATSDGWSVSTVGALAQWQADDPRNRSMSIEWLDLPAAIMADVYKESCAWIGTESYAYRQLGFIGLSDTLLGRALRHVAPNIFNRDVSDDEVICSEGCCRLVGDRWPKLDLRREGEPYAMISPQTAWDRYMDVLIERLASVTAVDVADHGDDVQLGI